ncbi:hypothetical protein GCM10011492_06660 [Flexivirga endophytica]|uniref:Uncharacterized protein n=1 Tax=Flexivirga endophytica TaxID=1849103 RepID=A0A916SY26_9MICO|nr:hypothetical protein [Flexivirga endophytica]GGB19491.1 hypothetical protein GCM10011492_06660 [Flexivirga endophytica]GHB36211.1 hypothetical protein GCM10008112_00950 [Flexivirga endophytica]
MTNNDMTTQARHRRDCADKSIIQGPMEGNRGDTIMVCGWCNWVTLVNDDGTVAEPIPKKVPPPIASGYVCREHTERRVSHTGKGCPDCTRERQKRARRDHRRAADEFKDTVQ